MERMSETTIAKRPAGGAKVVFYIIQTTEMILLAVAVCLVYYIFKWAAGVRVVLNKNLEDPDFAFHYALVEFTTFLASIGFAVFSIHQNVLLFFGSRLGCNLKLTRWWSNQRIWILVQLVLGGIFTFYYNLIPVYPLLAIVIYSIAIASFVNVYYIDLNECPCGCTVGVQGVRTYWKYIV